MSGNNDICTTTSTSTVYYIQPTTSVSSTVYIEYALKLKTTCRPMLHKKYQWYRVQLV